MSSMVMVYSPMRIVDGPAGKRRELITVEWARARKLLNMPFGRDETEFIVDGFPVAEARETATQYALDHDIELIFSLDNDVIVPPTTLHRLVYLADNNPEIDIFSGVYFCKANPAVPLIYKDGKPFWNWTPGELLVDGIDGCGLGCCLIRASLFQKLAQPWYQSTKACSADGRTSKNETEDLYMMRRAIKELGTKIMIDTSILCLHIDAKTGTTYGLPLDSIPGRHVAAFRAQQETANAGTRDGTTSDSDPG